MADKFLELTITKSVCRAQERYYGKSRRIDGAPERDMFTDEETSFVQSRDSFYMASISESGWPYIQHRGGKPGFLRVTSPTTLAFADYRGNRQLLSTGNLAANDCVALFLMDYAERTRLKILGRARVEDAREHPELVTLIAEPDMRRTTERLFLIDVISFDWNCPQYITPRYTAEEIQELVGPLQQRIAELEAQLRIGQERDPLRN
jgi:uncharacterized protein